MKRFTLIFFLIWLTLSQLVSQTETLSSYLNTLKKDPSLKSASWGICVKNVKTEETIASFNSDKVLIPASTVKIFTTASALKLLGKDYQYQTKLLYDGEIDSNGVLHGNLIIMGSGDPTFGSNRFAGTSSEQIFKKWLVALQKKNIKRINGKVIGDGSAYNIFPASGSWLWEDIGNYYATGSYGLNFKENFFEVYFESGKRIGDLAEFSKTVPDIPGVSFINRVTTAASNSGDNVYVYGSPYSNIRFLEGTIPAGKSSFKVKASYPDPALMAAVDFNFYLEKNGITISQQPKSIFAEFKDKPLVYKERKTISTHSSPKLIEIIKTTNLKSHNLFAEALLNTIGKEIQHSGYTQSGVKAINVFMIRNNLETFNLKDGSGLSRLNLISTEHFCNFLIEVNRDKFIADDFYNSLAIAGKTGYLANMFKGSAAENNLRGKTGYMNGIRAYTGYVTNKNGELLVFSIIVNYYSGSSWAMKKKLERLMVLMAESE